MSPRQKTARLDIAAQNGNEGNEAHPAALPVNEDDFVAKQRAALEHRKARTLASFGVDAATVGIAFWHPPDARERSDPIRIVGVDYVQRAGEAPRTKVLPSGQTVKVLAVFRIERQEGGERIWECLSARALQAMNDLADVGSWFTITSRGSGTDKTFNAKAWTGA